MIIEAIIGYRIFMALPPYAQCNTKRQVVSNFAEIFQAILCNIFSGLRILYNICLCICG